MELSLQDKERVKEVAERVLQCAKDVLDDLGPGWPEAVYQKAMEIALREGGIQYENQRIIPIYFREKHIVGEGRPDLLVWVDLEDGKRACVVFDLKCDTEIKQEHKNQVGRYIDALRKLKEQSIVVYNVGYVINFQKPSNTKLGEEVRGFPDDSSPLRYILVIT